MAKLFLGSAIALMCFLASPARGQGIMATIPGQAGSCYDPQTNSGGVTEKRINSNCDNYNFCSPINEFFPSGAPNPAFGTCSIRKTHLMIEVGQCVAAPRKSCVACPDGFTMICMVYQYHQPLDNGSCHFPCGVFEVMLNGTCAPRSPSWQEP